MNKEAILNLASVIEKNEPLKINGDPVQVAVDMKVWGKNGGCQTVACIAGHQFILNNERLPTREEAANYVVFGEAGSALGLDDDIADELFVPHTDILLHATRADAVLTLRKLADTGEVDWSHVDITEDDA